MLQDIGYAEKMIIYRYDISTGKLKKIADFDDAAIHINGYGSNVYMKVVTENNYGHYAELVNKIYSFSADSDQPILLPAEKSIDELYIFDEEWEDEAEKFYNQNSTKKHNNKNKNNFKLIDNDNSLPL